MRKRLLIVLCSAFLLGSCGVPEIEHETTEEAAVDQEAETAASESMVVVTDKEILQDNSYGKWQQTAYIVSA